MQWPSTHRKNTKKDQTQSEKDRINCFLFVFSCNLILQPQEYCSGKTQKYYSVRGTFLLGTVYIFKAKGAESQIRPLEKSNPSLLSTNTPKIQENFFSHHFTKKSNNLNSEITLLNTALVIQPLQVPSNRILSKWQMK